MLQDIEKALTQLLPLEKLVAKLSHFGPRHLPAEFGQIVVQ